PGRAGRAARAPGPAASLPRSAACWSRSLPCRPSLSRSQARPRRGDPNAKRKPGPHRAPPAGAIGPDTVADIAHFPEWVKPGRAARTRGRVGAVARAAPPGGVVVHVRADQAAVLAVTPGGPAPGAPGPAAPAAAGAGLLAVRQDAERQDLGGQVPDRSRPGRD